MSIPLHFENELGSRESIVLIF